MAKEQKPEMAHTLGTTAIWAVLAKGSLAVAFQDGQQTKIIPFGQIQRDLQTIADEGGKGKAVADRLLQAIEQAALAISTAMVEVGTPEPFKQGKATAGTPRRTRNE